MFERGYNKVREVVERNAMYVKSCFNCNYLVEEDGEDVCSNDNVLEYDLIVEENGRIYCHYWKPIREGDSRKGKMF